MANPNISGVTSIYGESIGEALTTTVTTAIMTVLANKVVKVNSITVANTNATVATLVTVVVSKVDFTSSGIGAAEDNAGLFHLAKVVSVPGSDVLVVLDKPIYLMETDNIEAGANPATADIFISYEVIDDA